MTDTARHEEVELKYHVRDPRAVEHYLTDASVGRLVGAAPARTVRMVDHYVDTADRALAQAGYAVRLRARGGSTIVSVKSLTHERGPAGAVRRVELEGPADRSAAPRDWAPSDARSLVLEHAGDAPLVELVTVRQVRRQRIVRDGATRVELSLDDVEVAAEGRVVGRFAEFEAEVVQGDPARLAALATRFDADPALTRSTGSKFESALAMLGEPAAEAPEVTADIEPGAPEPVTAEVEVATTEATPAPEPEPVAEAAVTPMPEPEPAEAPAATELAAPEPPALSKDPGVLADDHVAEAGRKILRFHLARMLAREDGVRLGVDPEEVHAMRVATRRQRAAWRVFGDAFRRGRTKGYQRGLRSIAARLGTVRDLDVLIEGMDAYRADHSTTEQLALRPLLDDWRTRREAARLDLERELDSDDYRAWVDAARDFVERPGAGVAPVGPTEPHRVRDTAPSRIWATYEAVRAYEPVLRWADVTTLHDLRIAAKWLRYTIEFVREPLGSDSGPIIAKVTALQDHLGELHDADVAAALARALLMERAGELSSLESEAIGRYLVDREERIAALRSSLAGPWHDVAGLSFRRALGRVVAGDLMPLLLIGLGGFFGAVARYAVDGLVTDRMGSAFPWGTLVINLTGSFLLGLLFGLSQERSVLPAEIRGPVLIGFIGAYTTFSTFMLESWRLVESGAWASALANLGGSIVLGLVAVLVGMTLGRAL